MTLQIELVHPGELKAAEDNPRRISSKALRCLARLMDQHGFVDPVIARREDKLVIGGHQRLRANQLRKNPDALVPCIFLDGVSDARAKALNIGLNNPAAQGRYDVADLGRLLQEIGAADLDLPAVTGFSPEELDELTASLENLTPMQFELPKPGDRQHDQSAFGESPCGPRLGGIRRGERGSDTVILIFALPADVYRKVKGEFDRLIAEHDLACHVRIEE